MLICWGGRISVSTMGFMTGMATPFSRARCHYFAQAGHYLLEDAFDEVRAG
jgi:hypothetical protein